MYFIIFVLLLLMQFPAVAYNESARNLLMTVVFESNSECWCRKTLFTLKLVFLLRRYLSNFTNSDETHGVLVARY